MSNYLQEWQESHVDEELTQLNVIPLQDAHPLNYLFYADELPRRNDGRVTSQWLEQYQHTAEGGWWCSGVDILTGKEELWGCFKPEHPRHNSKTGKVIKYEHPPKASAEIFALRVPLHLWQKIAQRYQVPLPPEAREQSQDKTGFAFWQWVLAHPQIPLSVTEGAKKAGALLTAGYVAIGLPGIYGGYRTPKDNEGKPIGKSQLIPQLEKLSAGKRDIYFIFDQDSKPNTIKAVNTAISKTGSLLQQLGSPVKVVTWEASWGKGVDDLIHHQGMETLAQIYEKALPLEGWRAQSLFGLTYPISLAVNERYLSNQNYHQDLNFQQAKLIGIKSPKNTGKTEFLSQVVAQALARQQKVLVIGHRIKLVEELCQRFQIHYLSDCSHQDEEKAPMSYGLCIDSLHPHSLAQFKPQDWQDGLVIIDEVEQVLWHGLNSTTCQKQRVAILKSLKALIAGVFSHQGQVIIADADLSDCSLEYLLKLGDWQGNPFLIRNHWQPLATEAYSAFYYPEKTPKRWVKELLSHIHKGGKPFIFLSAQKLTSRWGTLAFEAYLKKQFPNHKILRIDSESLGDQSHPAYQCMSRLNCLLQDYDIVLASPAIETGISINLKGHFTSVWSIAQGVQSAHSVCQSLGRIRDNIPRYLWIASYGFNKIGNGSTSIPHLLTAGNRLTQANIRLLQQADLENLNPFTLDFQSESLFCWAKMAVRINATMLNYRDAVLGILTQEGQTVQVKTRKKNKTVNLDSFHLNDSQKNNPDYLKNLTYFLSVQQSKRKEKAQNKLMAEINAVRDFNYHQDCVAIASAPELTFLDYSQLKKALVKTPQEKKSLRKYELQQRYCISVTPELVMKDDQKWYEQLRLHYYLSAGRQYLTQRDAKVAQQLIQNGEGKIFPPDFNHCQLGVMIHTLEKLGIHSLLNQPQAELDNEDLHLQKMAKLALENRSSIKTIFNIGLAVKSTPIMVLRRFLTKLGYGLTCLRQQRIQRKTIRIYQLQLPQDKREEIFQKWLILDQMALGNIQEELRQNQAQLFAHSLVQTEPISSYLQLSLPLKTLSE